MSKTDGEERDNPPPSAANMQEKGPLRAARPAVELGADNRGTQDGPHIQPKLTVNEPDDRYEREAERVTDAVMQTLEPDASANLEKPTAPGRKEPVIFRRATAESAANSAVQQQMDNISIPSGAGSEKTRPQETPSPLADPAEQFVPDRPMGDVERQQYRRELARGEQYRDLSRPMGESERQIVTMQPSGVELFNFPGGASLPVVHDYLDRFSDPLNTGNPLLDTSGVHREKNLTHDFTVDEYAQSGGNEFQRSRIDPSLMDLLQQIRDDVGTAVIINSGYRPPPYNEEVEGAEDSQHMGGRAADIRTADMTGRELAEVALQNKCDIGLGVGRAYIHVDVRGNWARWNYDPGPSVQWIDRLHDRVCG
ncbi:MAG: D-Ala-D-Ala carboxypeptidase family metallohydrolase [Salinibacter sp.]|uniref:YcbK family protein n=1 Tax=Salinibacter sp. TaxID=2065818 RepID=UPI002FC39DFF